MADQLQVEHYTTRAATYDEHALVAGDEHFVALEYMMGLCVPLGIRSVLDLGCGTGRAVRFIQSRRPSLRVVGVEPVEALVEVARNTSRDAQYLRARGDRLPFISGSFDAVCATGVLHHVRKPQEVVAEMLRVARRAVFISDSNRFGQGRFPSRFAKLALYRAGLGSAVATVQTRGRGFLYSEGDGQFYSYSVYDSEPVLRAWADRVLCIGTSSPQAGTWPLVSSGHVLLAAMKEQVPGFAEPPAASSEPE